MSVRMGVSGSGYATVHDPDTGDWVYVHRLAALVNYDPVEVAGKDVHHRDGNPWVNNPDNLEPVESGLHRGFNLPGVVDPMA